jgi:hypothetical protein
MGMDNAHCFKRAEDIIAKANAAQGGPTPSMESAGNASPSLPPQTNAYTHWNVDSGATAHMTPHRHWVHNYSHVAFQFVLQIQQLCILLV